MVDAENKKTRTQKDMDTYTKRLMRGESEISAKAGLKSFEPLEPIYIKQKTKRKITIDWKGLIYGLIIVIFCCLAAIFLLWLILLMLSEGDINFMILILVLMLDIIFLLVGIYTIYESIEIRYIRNKGLKL